MNAKLLANQVESLFSLPEVALRINDVLNSPEPSNAELEEIIISDPELRNLQIGGFFRTGETDALIATLESGFQVKANYINDDLIYLVSKSN